MEQSFMKIKWKFALALIAAAFAATALAQKPDVKGGTVVASEPGKATVARAVEVSARVVSIDKATRTVTLKGPKGNVVDVVAGDEVRNFDQIKVGDLVVARYAQALTLELRKVKGAVGDVTVREDTARAKPGDRPAAAGARQVTAIATVIAVDPKKSTITLKGPRGNVVVLDVQNPDQFKVVKKGDQVEVTYTEALALSVEPAPKPAAKPAKK
jgi:NMD protein affecting ribosome stability and mRNA decay